MKYPIGIQDFEKIIQNGYVYVDKTDLIYKLVNEGHVYFLCRPRRFGKSLLVSTLKYYFQGRKDLFKGLAIDSLETEWKEYPVFHLSFGTGNFTESQTLRQILEDYISEKEEEYGRNVNANTLGGRFASLLHAAHEKTGRRAVVLIDEYDKPLLDVLDTNYKGIQDGQEFPLEEINRNILKGFYSVFKDADQDLQFVLLTGVTKFSQVSVFSGFNQPYDISMAGDYESLCGITKEELLTVFDSSIKELAESMEESYEETVKRLKKKYDGYHFSDKLTGIFNPFSILNCFNSKRMHNFWFASGTPTYLVRLLAHFNENINELIGRYYAASQFIDYKADVERPLPMIYQSGYLTIKDVNKRRLTYLLDFPNEEVCDGFIDALACGYFKGSRTEPTSWVNDVTDALECGDTVKFEKLMTALLSSISYRFQRKQDPMECERYFQYTFFLIVKMLGFYNTVAEKETSEGRIDCVVECPNYVYVIEFKMNSSAEAALQQIEEKGYTKPYAADPRTVICLGINFSSQTGTLDGFKAVTGTGMLGCCKP